MKHSRKIRRSWLRVIPEWMKCFCRSVSGTVKRARLWAVEKKTRIQKYVTGAYKSAKTGVARCITAHTKEWAAAALAAGLVVSPLVANAAPEGGAVVGGQATIAQVGDVTNIAQASQRAAIDWTSFSIAPKETVNFIQPNAQAVALNRVLGNNPSEIYGHLNANGQVYLSNPNGMLFAPGAEVNVAGLIATTSHVDPLAFMQTGLISTSEHNAAIDMQGSIFASGGLVEIKGASAINVGGLIKAMTIEGNGGVITLESGGDTINTGTLDASSVSGNGGQVYLLGDHVGMLDSAVINADGASGGGTVRIGGGWQGGDGLAAATSTYMAPLAMISASATSAGDAGSVVLWSKGATDFEGHIFADTNNGQGGRIETSGKENLQVGAGARVSMLGNGGEWLLDPETLNIVSSGGTKTPPVNANDNPGTTQSVDVSAIEAVSSGTVVLQATSSGYSTIDVQSGGVDGCINLQSNVNLLIQGGLNANYITIMFSDTNIKIKASGTGTITLDTNTDNTGYLSNIGELQTDTGNVTLWGADGITLSNKITTNGGNVDIDADADQQSGGGFTLGSGAPITTNGGNVKFKAGTSGVTLNAKVTTGTGRVEFATTGGSTATYTLNSEISCTGDIALTQNVSMGQNAAITTTGNVSFTANATMYGTSNLALTGTGFSFSQPLAGNGGTITFRPPTATSDMLIDSGMRSALGSLSGFSSVTCGRSDGTGTLSFNADTSVTNPTTFIMGGVGGIVNVSGNITASGTAGITLDAGGALNIANNLTTATGAIIAQGKTLTIDSGKTLTSTSGNITIAADTPNLNGTASSSGKLTLRPYSANPITIGTVTHVADTGLLIDPVWLSAAGGKFSNFTSLVVGDPTVTNGIYIDNDCNDAYFSGGIAFNSGNGGITEKSGVAMTTTHNLLLTAKGAIAADNATNDFAGVTFVNTGTGANGNVTITDANALTITGTNSGQSIVVKSGAGSDLTITGAAISSGASGNAIKLESGNNFINSGGTAVLTTVAGGRWLVYSKDPTSDTPAGSGLQYNFKQYGATPTTTVASATGNGVLYTVAPTVVFALGGSATKIYDGNVTVTDPGNLSVVYQSGAIGNDNISGGTVTSATYDTKNAGTLKLVSISGVNVTASQLVGWGTGTVPVYGYVTSSGISNNVGRINAAGLVYTATAASRTYGAVNPAFAGTITGFVNGETQTDATTGTMAFSSAATPTDNVGGYNITGSGLTANHGNYTFAQA
ncbi:MAG: filamentous hemagglutinin N-terminal domain-containing protein, partial [Bacillota bacterium]